MESGISDSSFCVTSVSLNGQKVSHEGSNILSCHRRGANSFGLFDYYVLLGMKFWLQTNEARTSQFASVLAGYYALI